RRAGLAAHDVGAAGGDQLVGRVRLTALELLDRERAGEAGHLAPQVVLECADVEGVAFGHGFGAGVVIHGPHFSAMASSRSRDSTTSRVGSTRTAPSRSKPLSSW